MAIASFEIKGLRELEANLNKLGDQTVKRLLRPALQKAADPIVRAVVQGARVAEGGPTYPIGRLPSGRTSGIRGPGHMFQNIVTAVSLTRTKGARIKIGPDKEHWYAAFQEFGTPNSPAKPFLRPALDLRGRAAVEILGEELGKAIEQAADNLGSGAKE